MKHWKDWQNKPWANTAIAACIAILFYVLITHLHIIGRGLAALYGFVRPVFLGLVIAYVLNPLAKFFERSLFRKIQKEEKRRMAATALTILAVVLGITLLLSLLIPQLIDSVRTFVSNIGAYTQSLQTILQRLNSYTGSLHIDLSNPIDRIEEFLGSLSLVVTDNMDSILGVTSSIGSNVLDGILGFIVAIYFMADKYRLMNMARRILHRLLPDDRYGKLSDYWQRCNEIFVRFIAFDLLDGLVVGIVNCIFMLIAGIPYSVLISVVVGVTNLAPTFGPVIGAIIGAFILVLVNPWYALWFLIFTIILQVVDGYVLKPRIFGGSLGVPAIWILITIIIGGRMFGVPGILLAIPFAAIVLFVCQEFFPSIFPPDNKDD